MEAYNAAVTDGRVDPTVRDGLATRGLALAKSNWAQRLDTPPFVAYPVTGGITFTFGGVRVNGWRPHQICCQGVARTFQNIRLFRELTALDNVRVACHQGSSAGWVAALPIALIGGHVFGLIITLLAWMVMVAIVSAPSV